MQLYEIPNSIHFHTGYHSKQRQKKSAVFARKQERALFFYTNRWKNCDIESAIVEGNRTAYGSGIHGNPSCKSFVAENSITLWLSSLFGKNFLPPNYYLDDV